MAAGRLLPQTRRPMATPLAPCVMASCNLAEERHFAGLFGPPAMITGRWPVATAAGVSLRIAVIDGLHHVAAVFQAESDGERQIGGRRHRLGRVGCRRRGE